MYALRGQRDYQEDCGFAIELGEHLLIGIADGFGKPGHAGIEASRAVVQEALRSIGSTLPDLLANPEEALRTMFARINERTARFVAGSTLSLAVIDRGRRVVTLAAVGDSVIALTDRNGVLHIFPQEELGRRDRGLMSAFGDAQHGATKVRIPFVEHYPLGDKSVLVIASDGLYPVEPPNDLVRMRELAGMYLKLVRGGAGPQRLAEFAIREVGSPDNVTVGVYAAQE